MDHRRVEPRGAVGDAAIGRAPGLGRLHQARHLGQERVLGRGGRLEGERAAEIERAGLQAVAGRDRPGNAFAGDQRAVDLGPSLDDAPIDRHAIAGRQQHRHARPDVLHGQVALRSVGLPHRRAARRKPGQSLDGRARPLAHHVVERAADQQEEQQRGRGVEIGVRAVMDGLVEAHAEGQQDADRDRHVHVGAAMTQRLPGRAEEDAPGIDEARQGDRGRQPMEEIARLGIGAGPDGDRQHHDVAGGEARDRQRPHECAERAILRGGTESWRWASKPASFNAASSAGGAAPCQATVTRRVERLTRARVDVRQITQNTLDPRDTGAAVDPGHAEVALPQAGRDLAACQQQFVVSAGSLDRHARSHGPAGETRRSARAGPWRG